MSDRRRVANVFADAEPLAPRLTRMQPNRDALPEPIAWDPAATPAAVAARWNRLATPHAAAALYEPEPERYGAHLESFIGCVRVPVGIAGPLRIHGLFACGDYVVPLATTEAALVASVHRGATVISEAGGCSAAVVDEGLARTPVVELANLADALAFVSWALESLEGFRAAAEATTRHGRLHDVSFTIEGRRVHLHIEMSTGEAAGQNMASLATEAVLGFVATNAPVRPLSLLHEGNLAGEKRGTHATLQSVRGKRVVAEVMLPADLVERRLGVTAEGMVHAFSLGASGATLSGAPGRHAMLANPLAALYVALGQDIACVAEAAVGVTSLELDEGALRASVTIPNLVVGTVGGGTALPGQRACLDLVGVSGPDSARALAEICGATCLAGELSVIAALADGRFAEAHRTLARLRANRGAR